MRPRGPRRWTTRKAASSLRSSPRKATGASSGVRRGWPRRRRLCCGRRGVRGRRQIRAEAGRGCGPGAQRAGGCAARPSACWRERPRQCITAPLALSSTRPPRASWRRAAPSSSRPGWRRAGAAQARGGRRGRGARPVEAPDFKRRIEGEQGRNFRGGAAGDDGDAGAALARIRQELRYASKGAGLEAVHAEGGQGAVVIEEQKRGRAARKGRKNWSKLGAASGITNQFTSLPSLPCRRKAGPMRYSVQEARRGATGARTGELMAIYRSRRPPRTSADRAGLLAACVSVVHEPVGASRSTGRTF